MRVGVLDLRVKKRVDPLKVRYLTVHRLSPDGQTAPTVLKVIQE